MKIYKKNIAWRMRKIAKRNLLINGVSTFELDEVGAFFYKQFNGSDDLNSIAKNISKKYEIDFEVAYKDLIYFSDKLLSEDVIKLVE